MLSLNEKNGRVKAVFYELNLFQAGGIVKQSHWSMKNITPCIANENALIVPPA